MNETIVKNIVIIDSKFSEEESNLLETRLNAIDPAISFFVVPDNFAPKRIEWKDAHVIFLHVNNGDFEEIVQEIPPNVEIIGTSTVDISTQKKPPVLEGKKFKPWPGRGFNDPKNDYASLNWKNAIAKWPKNPNNEFPLASLLYSPVEKIEPLIALDLLLQYMLTVCGHFDPEEHEISNTSPQQGNPWWWVDHENPKHVLKKEPNCYISKEQYELLRERPCRIFFNCFSALDHKFLDDLINQNALSRDGDLAALINLLITVKGAKEKNGCQLFWGREDVRQRETSNTEESLFCNARCPALTKNVVKLKKMTDQSQRNGLLKTRNECAELCNQLCRDELNAF